MGPAAARNIALDRSEAPIWCVLDADDYLLPDRFAAMAKDRSCWDLLADDILFAEEQKPDLIIGRLLADPCRRPRASAYRNLRLGNISRRGKLRRELGFLKPLVRRQFMDDAHLRYDPRLRLGEDYIFYASALARGARFKLSITAGVCGGPALLIPQRKPHDRRS